MVSVKELYINLMKQGMTLPEIDGMDILFYFELIKHTNEKKNRVTPVDEIGWL